MKIGFFIISFLCCTTLFCQNKPVFFATKHYRDSITNVLVKDVDEITALPLNDTSYERYETAFWAMSVMLYKPKNYETIIPNQIALLPKMETSFQRAFLEMLHTLYQNKFAKNLQAIWQQLGTNKVKAMALEYMANAGTYPNISTDSSFTNSVYFNPYNEHFQKANYPKQANFLSKTFLPGQVVLCSFQSNNRNKPGYLMIRTANHQWLKSPAGKPYKFTQLARAISNMPYYITNGNTPQGLFKLNGYDTSKNRWIGPTTNLQMQMPFEYDLTFFENDTAFVKYYSKLLGSSLINFNGLWQSFTAGKIGRSEIIAHGTTINPAYYKNQTYYPCTPSLGCLCSPEIWDDNGKQISSEQQKWIKVLMDKKLKPNYLIVAEIANL